jgi:transcriptional regulator with XRE-family HTH domain
MRTKPNPNGHTPDRDTERDRARQNFAQALTWVLDSKGVSHRELAEGLGWPGHTRIYAWLSGRTEPPVEEITAIERWLDLEPGFLSLRLAGCVVVPLEDAVTLDPTLPEWAKDAILSVITAARKAEATKSKSRR